MKMKIMKQWIPVEVDEDESKITTKVWGREYRSGKESFLESILSQKQEILASSIRFVGEENGREFVLGNFQNYVMSDSDEEKAIICSSAESGAFILNTCLNIEYDGCIDMSISIMPQGRSVKQALGLDLDGLNGIQFSLTRLWMEIPIKPEVAKFYHFYPLDVVNIDGKDIDTEEEINHILQSEYIPQSIKWSFPEQVFVGNDEVGVGMFLESDRYTQPKDGKLVELERRDGEVVLRIRLLDSEPELWEEKGTMNGIDLHPISYRIGLIATPVREFPEHPYEERNLHIDCFKKIPPEQMYDDFLTLPFEETGEITFDRIERLGVKTLYIHEKWNDLQNSPILTKKTADRLRLIVEEAHKRGIKVIPYFGFEISTLSPYWQAMGEEVMVKETEKNYNASWYRQPPQRAIKVCYSSKWQDIFVDGIAKMMDKFSFDGIYIDSMVRPLKCMNEKHGCGWRDREGNLHHTYPVWGIRSLLKKLYKIVTDRGGTINNHSCAAFNMATLGFCHSMWEGEAIQQTFMQGNVSEIPEGHFRSMFSGRNLGVPIYMLCYQNPPIWNFTQGMSVSLPFGIIPKSNDTGKPLEQVSDIWKVMDKFDFKGAKWCPYYDEDKLLNISNSLFKVSCFENGDKLLMMCANSVDRRAETEVSLEDGNIKVIDVAASCNVETSNGRVMLFADKFDYAVILAEKN